MKYFEEIDIFHDGWVFLLGGSNNVRDYWVNKKKIPESTLNEWLTVYKERIKYFEDNKIKYISFFAPEKLTVYSNKSSLMIDDAHIPSRQLINYLQSNADFDVDKYICDIVPFLRSQSNEYLIYHKTDSHWNFLGAFSAYQLIQSRLNEPTFTEALLQPRNYNWNIMDLGGKFDPPLKEKTFYYRSTGNFERVFANDLVKMKEREQRENDPGLHVGSYVVFKNEFAISNKTVVIFGDSFSEYREHLFTGLLAETYKEVHFIWNTTLDFNLISEIKPDIVISEMAERFIPRPARH